MDQIEDVKVSRSVKREIIELLSEIRPRPLSRGPHYLSILPNYPCIRFYGYLIKLTIPRFLKCEWVCMKSLNISVESTRVSRED